MNYNSAPSDLRITDIRFADTDGTPKHCCLLKIFTNQGIVGYGELRDAASKSYALMLKSRLLGENPCNYDKIFRRIKRFGGPGRQGGGVSGIEVALMDLAGKAYGVPVYQLLGGKYRDRIRVYCDTDADERNTPENMGNSLKERISQGYTFLKMDLGIGYLSDKPGALCAPGGLLEEMKKYCPQVLNAPHGSMAVDSIFRGKAYDLITTPHQSTGMQVTDYGFSLLEEYLRKIRSIIGYEIPLAIDHFGHVRVEDCIRFAQICEHFNIAWLEDLAPWPYTGFYKKLCASSRVPICTGEDIYLAEGFRPLLDAGGVSIIHPDVLTIGGVGQLKRAGDLADDYGVGVALHMGESPIGCLASAHAAAAIPHVLALEFHSADCADLWNNMVVRTDGKKVIENGYCDVPNTPGLGIESLNEKLIAQLIHKDVPGFWEPTEDWNADWANDRQWG